MATFPSYNPQYSATKRSQPQQRITQFGDGYQQRTTFGLNQDPKFGILLLMLMMKMLLK